MVILGILFFLLIFMCTFMWYAICRSMYVLVVSSSIHACGGLRWILGIFLELSSKLFIDSGSPELIALAGLHSQPDLHTYPIPTF